MMNTIQSKSIQIINNNGNISKNFKEMKYDVNAGKGFINHNGKIYLLKKNINNDDVRSILNQKSNNNTIKNDLKTVLKKQRPYYTPMYKTRKKRKKVNKKKRKKRKKQTKKKSIMNKIKNVLGIIN